MHGFLQWTFQWQRSVCTVGYRGTMAHGYQQQQINASSNETEGALTIKIIGKFEQ